MIRTPMPARPSARRPLAWSIAAALSVGGLVLAPSVGAGAATADPLACPASYPVSALRAPAAGTPGTAVTGLTTSQGTTPDAITGSYVGTIDDGAAAGKDLLVFRLAGSRITHPDGSVDAGIWAGMSGSPLYADSNGDGVQELVGAVSYGFSLESSDYAGVTPAADLRGIDKAPTAASRSAVPARLGAALRADGASASAVRQGFRRLPVPRAVAAGASGSRLAGLARRTGFASVFARASAGSPASSRSYPVHPGGTIATSYAFGGVSFTGVGTVTMVCGGKVFAYGHPDSFTGPSTMGLHGAAPVLVQRDDSAGSAVIANVGARVGQVTQDRTSGILGVLGRTPPTTTVRSKVTVVGEGTRTSLTRVSVADALPFAVDAQAVGEVDTLYDGWQQGTADVAWTVRGTRAHGRPFTISGSNRVADRYDVGAVTSADVVTDLFEVLENEFEDVRITDVALSTVVTPRYHAYRVAGLRAKQGGAWRPVGEGSRVKVKPGKKLRLQVTLAPQRGSVGRTRTVTIATKVPRRYRGEFLQMFIGGLADQYGDIGDEELIETDVEPMGTSRARPRSLSAVLTSLAGNERNDQLVATLYAPGDELEGMSVVRRSVVRAPSVVSGSATVLVKVRR